MMPVLPPLAVLLALLALPRPSSGASSTCSRDRDVDQTTYAYDSNVRASSRPPGGLSVSDAPQFVSLTLDDNGFSGLNGAPGGVEWVVDMLEQSGQYSRSGGGPKATFFFTTQYIDVWMRESPTYVKASWRGAVEAGHEPALHSHTHRDGGTFSFSAWWGEIRTTEAWLAKPYDPSERVAAPNRGAGIGAARSDVAGWRAPFLRYNDAMFQALVSNGVWYDSSIEDGWQWSQDGTNYYWPYTLDRGSPGHDATIAWGAHETPLTPRPGLWEMPMHPFVVPPDSRAAKYGIETGLRSRCKNIASWFDVRSGKITGMDYNLFVDFRMTGKEVLATLKYTLSLRLKGNRAPFFVGLHSDIYSDNYAAANQFTTGAERRQALADFVRYALSKEEVRMVPVREVMEWMRDPLPLECVR